MRLVAGLEHTSDGGLGQARRDPADAPAGPPAPTPSPPRAEPVTPEPADPRAAPPPPLPPFPVELTAWGRRGVLVGAPCGQTRGMEASGAERGELALAMPTEFGPLCRFLKTYAGLG